MRITVLHNPLAGNDTLGRDELLAALRSAGHTVAYRATTEDAGLGLQDPGDVLLAAGGDGTVRRAALRLVGSPTPVAVLPLGTANNVARALGIPAGIEALIETLAAGCVTPVDAGIVRTARESGHFIEGIGFGLFAESMAVAKTNAEHGLTPPLGAAAELEHDVRLLRALLPLHRARECRIVLDHETIDSAMLLVEIMNIASIGPVLHLAPDADPADGVLEIVFAPESARAELAAFLEDRSNGHENAVPALPRRRAGRCRIEWRAPLAHIDDTRWTPDHDNADHDWHTFDVAVERQALWFLLPAAA
jgi:diacylglycerol kinase (ATP)